MAVDNKITVGLEITGNGEQASRSVKSIKTELREATQEAFAFQRKFGEFSPEAEKAKDKLAKLKNEITDFRDQVDALNPDRKFQAVTKSLQGVAGGFAGVQGAIGLFGTESAELEKQLLKVQSALALSEGINSILEAQDSFKNLGALIKGNVTKAFSTLKGAIISTGIGALVIGVGLLIANFEEVKKVVLNFIPGLAKVGDFIGKIIQKVTDFAGVTSEAERAYERLKKSTANQNDELDRQIKLLQAQGGQEEKIAKLQKQKIDNQIAVSKANKNKKDEDIKNEKDLENEKLIIAAQEKKRLDDIARQQSEKAKEEKQKRIEEAKKREEERQQQYIADIKAKEDQANYESQVFADTVADLSEQDQQAKDDASERQRIATATDLEYAQRNYEAKKELDKLSFEDKKKRTEETIGLLNNLASIIGQQTAAGKALAIATALINTYQGASEALKEKSTLPQPFSTIARFAAAGAIIANGIRTVKQITSVKVPSGGGGGGQGGSNPISGTAPVTAPIAQGVSVQQTAVTNGVNIKNTDAIKAYVVERDITDSQDRIAKIKASATFGG